MSTFVCDLASRFVGGGSLRPQVCAASTDALLGDAVDMLNGDGSVFAYLTLGTVTGSGVDIDVKIQECATTNGTFTDMAAGGTFTQSYNETTGDNVSSWITCHDRTMRYVRGHASVTSTTSVTAVPISVSVFSMKKVLGGSGTVTS